MVAWRRTSCRAELHVPLLIASNVRNGKKLTALAGAVQRIRCPRGLKKNAHLWRLKMATPDAVF